eukprot:1160235-Pelagomonas_calceolata.AAC.2
MARHLITSMDGTDKSQKVFISVPTEVGQTEAEEIEILPTNVQSARAFISLFLVINQHFRRQPIGCWISFKQICACTHLRKGGLGVRACLTHPYAGVEHLLRDVKDATISTLATDVGAKLEIWEESLRSELHAQCAQQSVQGTRAGKQ